MLYFPATQKLLAASVTNVQGHDMTHGYRVVLDLLPGATASIEALSAGSRAATLALSTFDAVWMERLRPLASRRREELDGFDYLDSSVLEYALLKALEAAFPETDGKPSPPLNEKSFILHITKDEANSAENEVASPGRSLVDI
jgi:hypothetical protein